MKMKKENEKEKIGCGVCLVCWSYESCLLVFYFILCIVFVVQVFKKVDAGSDDDKKATKCAKDKVY